MADFNYITVNRKLTDNEVEAVHRLYKVVFSNYQKASFAKRIQSATDLLCLLAKENETLVGFKIGYALNKTTFYSWVGGVHPDYRKMGIAKQLQQIQENHLIEKGYKTLHTKSTNQFKPMMQFNLKNGFDIVGTEHASNGIKILFEKSL